MEFNNITWHDSIIKSILIDRTHPGLKDCIKFEMMWPNGKKGELIFEGVYGARLDLNFGIVAEETILDCEQLEDDIELSNLYSKWKGLINEVKLYSYTIKLSSTGGEIKIISRGFKVI